MIRLFFYLFFIPGVFVHSSIALKFFSKQPPYELRSFYLFKLESSIQSLEERASLNTCCVIVNSNNKSLESELNLVKLPTHQTILWIGSSKKRCHLLETLLNEGNIIKTLSSKKRKELEKSYLEIKPDIILLPLHLKKLLETVVLKHSSQKKPLAIFYPSAPPSRNFIVTLSPEALQKKISSCKLAKGSIEALAYDNTSVPTESFLLKKLTFSKEGTILLKKEKRLIFNKGTITSHDKILAMGKSLEDLKLALGGFLYELEKQNILASIHTKTFDKHLDNALSSCVGSLYLFIPETAPSNKAFLKKLKRYFKNHPDKTIFIGYYRMPWREQWNLYHYNPHSGSRITASMGLNKLTQNNNLSLDSLGGSFAECYLLKPLP